MKNLIALFLLTLSINIYAQRTSVDMQPLVSVGVRAGTDSDLNDNPAPYVSLKLKHLQYGNSTRSASFFVPGIGMQSMNGSTKINLSVSPVVFNGQNDWSFGVDWFTKVKDSKSGNGSFGFFIGKGF